jgi:3-hydroxyisobutyrate dehydrogenase-like beta-hydroxyacid dehydrogenase
MRVGFIGLGLMGRPMVRRLLGAGHRVAVYNRSRPAVDELAAAGAVATGSASEAAEGAEVVLTALPTIDSVRLVYSELARTASPGQVYADHSTVDLETSRWCALAMPAFLDAPVSGGPAGVEAGTLTIMVGGSEAHYERALPVFGAYGGTVRLCGPTGAGTAVKLVNQLLVGIHTAAAAEAMAFGARIGAEPQVVLDMIAPSFGGSMMLSRNGPRFIKRDFSPATPVRIVLKDLGIIRGEGEASGAPLPLGALALEDFQRLAEAGFLDQDMAAMITLYEGDAAG